MMKRIKLTMQDILLILEPILIIFKIYFERQIVIKCYKINLIQQIQNQQQFIIIINKITFISHIIFVDNNLSKHKMQQQVKSSLIFSILPSERLITYNPLNDDIQLSLNIKAENYVTNANQTKLVVISGKSVRCYNVENGLKQNQQTVLEAYFPKKVQGLSIDNQDKIVISDKFGDIYIARAQNPIYMNSNLGIPTFIKHISNSKTKNQYIILGDDYCKIKIYNYKNMHEVTGIWYISNSIPLDLLKVDDQRFILLVKHQDKENLKHTYKLYQFDIQNLQKGDFNGKLVYSDKSQPLNSSQYHPCSITYSQVTKQLYFLKLYDSSVQITSFITNDQNHHFIQSKQYKLTLPSTIKQANSIDGQYIKKQSQQFMLITYGRYYDVESQTSVLDGQTKLINWETVLNVDQSAQVFQINDKEFLLKWKLN